MPLFQVEVPGGGEMTVWAKKGASDDEIIENAIKQQQMENYAPIDDMSGIEKFFAGMGKSVYDTGRGIKQIFGGDVDVDAIRERDAPLMDSGAGLAGNITGHVVQSLLPGGLVKGAATAAKLPGWAAIGGRMMAPSTLTGAGLLGGGYTALQPVAEGESRGLNAAMGAGAGVGGALLGRGIGGAWQGAKALTEPLRAGGRQKIAGRVASRYASNPAKAAQNLRAAQELVPGSKPTMAQAAQDPGLSMLERTISDMDPAIGGQLTERYNAQNAAWVQALQKLAGTGAKQQAASTARKVASQKSLKVFLSGAESKPANTPSVVKLVDGLLKGYKGKRLAVRRVFTPIRNMLVDEADPENIKYLTDPVELYGVRSHIVDELNKQAGGSKVNAAVSRELGVLLEKIDKVIRDAAPTYKQFMRAYASKSKPIDRMKVGQELIKKSVSALEKTGGEGTLHPEAYARAIRDGTKLIRSATGYKRGTLEKLMTPKQMQMLKAIEKDAARFVEGRGSGKSLGSPTLQNMASKNLLRQTLGPLGMPESWLEANILGGGWGKIPEFAMGGMQGPMNDQMLQIALNPQLAADAMMQGSSQWISPGLLNVLRSGSVAIPTGILASERNME